MQKLMAENQPAATSLYQQDLGTEGPETVQRKQDLNNDPDLILDRK